MNEYIERQALLNKLKERDLCLCITEQDIKDAPAADVAPVLHGKWINRVDTDTDMHECSICGARVVKGLYEYDNPNNYCYHCGAKMDSEDLL